MYSILVERQAILLSSCALAGVVFLLLSACAVATDGSETPAEPSATATQPPAATQPATEQTATEQPGTTPPEEPMTSEVPPEIAAQAKSALADHLGVVSDTLTLTTAEARDWSDGAMGCPAPDTSYIQVIIPGYLLILRDEAGERYAIHTSDTADPLILCQDGLPVPLGPSSS